MEESMMSPLFSDALNFLSLGLSVVLLFAIAYLWSSNNTKSAQIETLQAEFKRMKKKVDKVEEKVNQIREPQVVAEVPQAAPFGLDLSESLPTSPTSSSSQDPWKKFVEDYNELAAGMSAPGKLNKCEDFVREKKLRILTYGGSMTFRPAIDVKDSSYWAFKFPGEEEFAVVPNPMKPCNEELYDEGGIKEAFALNYQSGVYKKYFVKLPAIFTCEPSEGWRLKNPGVVNLERQ